MMKAGDEVICNSDVFHKADAKAPNLNEVVIIEEIIDPFGGIPRMLKFKNFEFYFTAYSFELMRTRRVFDAKLRPLLALGLQYKVEKFP